MAGVLKIKIVRKAPLLETEPVETEAQRQSRLIRNRSKTPRQRKDYPSDDPRHMSHNERLDALFPGHSDLRKLAKGIVSEKKKPISKKTGRREQCLPGNSAHDSLGRFSSGEDAGGSWSTGQTSAYAASKEQRTSCDRGQTRRSGKVRTWTRVVCGQASRDERKRDKEGRLVWVRCKDGQTVVREDSLKIPTGDADKLTQVDLDKLISQLRKKQDHIAKLTKKVEMVKNAKCQAMSVKDLAIAINAVERGKKGKLGEPPGEGK